MNKPLMRNGHYIISNNIFSRLLEFYLSFIILDDQIFALRILEGEYG